MILKNIFVCLLVLNLAQSNSLKDITGKWKVEKVAIGKLPGEPKTKEVADARKAFTTLLTNAIFNFNKDHRFSLSVSIGNMPKNDIWEYDKTKGLITVREANNGNSKLMIIKVEETEGAIYFEMQESTVVLKMQKQP